MSKEQIEQIIRYWKDEEYRNSLSAEERAELPENPVGMVELEVGELYKVQGGAVNTYFLCTSIIVSPW